MRFWNWMCVLWYIKLDFRQFLISIQNPTWISFSIHQLSNPIFMRIVQNKVFRYYCVWCEYSVCNAFLCGTIWFFFELRNRSTCDNNSRTYNDNASSKYFSIQFFPISFFSVESLAIRSPQYLYCVKWYGHKVHDVMSFLL